MCVCIKTFMSVCIIKRSCPYVLSNTQQSNLIAGTFMFCKTQKITQISPNRTSWFHFHFWEDVTKKRTIITHRRIFATPEFQAAHTNAMRLVHLFLPLFFFPQVRGAKWKCPWHQQANWLFFFVTGEGAAKSMCRGHQQAESFRLAALLGWGTCKWHTHYMDVCM